ncbi:heme/hemin ABC transporter substrate-binding protein [Chachezhania sediminis]|uniref:heme/hemin ABC transporter substrate-binding protein n=1 Tax=Chachezhania sediminis TaxID=2599291 RepID=UPI00131E786F|nr:ABC transporter substrate-binding protein [Chachezhania sediminis]
MRRLPLIGRIQVAMSLALVLLLAAQSARAEGPQRVISAGSAITEIVFALGEEHRLVGRDSTSTYPAAANAIESVGYLRALSPEGVLSLGPDLIIATDGAGPPQTLDVLKAAGVDYVELDGPLTPDGVADAIRTVGKALGVEDKAEALATQTEAEMKAAIAAAAPPEGKERKKVLFIISAQGGNLMAAGDDTEAEAVIRMAGGRNAVAGFTGYKPLSPEAVQMANPDVILMMDRGGDHAVSNEALFALPQLATSPAATNDAVVRMSGILLLGFGPRTPQAIAQLSRALAQDPPR